MIKAKNTPTILFVTMRAGWGGAPMHIDLIIKNINFLYKIFVACPIEDPYGNKWFNLLGRENFFVLSYRKFSFLKLLGVRKFVLKNKIKTLHAHGKEAGVYVRFFKILFLPKVKVIYTLHGFHIDTHNSF